ncbi:MAG TPA: hypothetical protein VMF89_19310, partial [Polyangiales bacterium]|nr:hypothetical protein [Polyangiales bacterium]
MLALSCSWGCGAPAEDDAFDEDSGAVVAVPSDASGTNVVDASASADAALGQGNARLDAGATDADSGRGTSSASDAGTANDASRNVRDAAPSADAGDARVDSGSVTDASTPDTGTPGECDWSEPPANVAAWINESWNSQLGANIRNRKAWNL